MAELINVPAHLTGNDVQSRLGDELGITVEVAKYGPVSPTGTQSWQVTFQSASDLEAGEAMDGKKFRMAGQEVTFLCPLSSFPSGAPNS